VVFVSEGGGSGADAERVHDDVAPVMRVGAWGLGCWGFMVFVLLDCVMGCLPVPRHSLVGVREPHDFGDVVDTLRHWGERGEGGEEGRGGRVLRGG